jgi:hypothetical protein
LQKTIAFFSLAKPAHRVPELLSLAQISRATPRASAAILALDSSGLTAAADAIAITAAETIAVAVAGPIAVAAVPAVVLASNAAQVVDPVITAATPDRRAVLNSFPKC